MSIYTRQNPPQGFYIYAYIRTKDSAIAKAGTPYYIGKGIGDRAWRKNKNERIRCPKEPHAIVIMESNLTNIGSLALERRYIQWYGREDMGTGILRNRTHGGEGFPGPKSEKTKNAISKGLTGRTFTEEHRRNVSKASKGRIPWNKGKKGLQVCWNKGLPVSDETREKISKSKKGKTIPWNKGKKGSQVAWNKGLTKDMDERIKNYGMKLSITKSKKRTIYTCDEGDYEVME